MTLTLVPGSVTLDQIKSLREAGARIGLPERRNELGGSRGPCLPMSTPPDVAARASPSGEP